MNGVVITLRAKLSGAVYCLSVLHTAICYTLRVKNTHFTLQFLTWTKVE